MGKGYKNRAIPPPSPFFFPSFFLSLFFSLFFVLSFFISFYFFALASYIYARATPDFHTMPDLYPRNGCFSSFSRCSRARKCNSIEWDIRHVDIRFTLNDNRTGYLDAMCIWRKKKERRRKNAIRVEVYSGYFCNEMSRMIIEKSTRVTLSNFRVWSKHRSIILTRFSSAFFVPPSFDRLRE